MSIPPISAGGPNAGSPISAENSSLDPAIEAIMLARFEALKELVGKQAERVQAMNHQIRALNEAKAELACKPNPTDEDRARLEDLDTELTTVINRQSMEMMKLQDLAAKMTQSQEAANAIAKKFHDTSAGWIANAR
ncbi:hypothetical protein D3C87_639820 [compost metagenome]|uniref:hypothetical protein n=1 Tax=Achromobacter sp. Root83 TaxID=1736602 RepID=UPI0007095F85|nr:hypothetical protein [Achromobacter sp. Root83]KRC85977.1 hypothetical protein ASE30_03210 [Achromobacter sp. Root83]